MNEYDREDWFYGDMPKGAEFFHTIEEDPEAGITTHTFGFSSGTFGFDSDTQLIVKDGKRGFMKWFMDRNYGGGYAVFKVGYWDINLYPFDYTMFCEMIDEMFPRKGGENNLDLAIRRENEAQRMIDRINEHLGDLKLTPICLASVSF